MKNFLKKTTKMHSKRPKKMFRKQIGFIAVLFSLACMSLFAESDERSGFVDGFDETKYKEATFEEATRESKNWTGEPKYFKTKCHIIENTQYYGYVLGFYSDADRKDFNHDDTKYLHSFPKDISMFTSVEIYYHYFAYAGSYQCNGKEIDGWKVLDDVRFVGQRYKATGNLRIRESPSLQAGQVGRIPQGEYATILEVGEKTAIDGIESAWVKVRTQSGKEGWCFAGYLTDGTEYREKPWTSGKAGE